MTWGKTSDRDEQRRRGDALADALADYHGPAGLPISETRQGDLGQTSRRASKEGRVGSRGGTPIWSMREAWMPSRCTCGTADDGPARTESLECPRHGPRRRLKRLMDKGARERGRWAPTDGRESPYRVALAGGHGRGFPDGAKGADPDGFAVFGRFPKGFLAHVLRTHLLGDVRRDDVLHLCSGTLSDSERWTVDIRSEARPRVQANGTALPFRDGSFAAVMLDPPYSAEYARHLYGVENPRPAWLLREAARVVRPGGRIGILHVAIPFAPPGCHLVKVYGISTGVGFRIRALTVYERAQESLL